MNEEKEKEQAAAIAELIANSNESGQKADEKLETAKDTKGIFQKYKIKDIVFLAIITCCTLVTGAIMPLLVNVPLFGIIQLGLGIQFSRSEERRVGKEC